MEDFRYGMEMEWKKIASMEYGKIVFHSIPYHALLSETPVRSYKFQYVTHAPPFLKIFYWMHWTVSKNLL